MSQRKKWKMDSARQAGEVAPAGGAGAASPAAAIAAPDPEVRAVARRRSFPAAYKLSVLAEAERASGAGDPAGAIATLLTHGRSGPAVASAADRRVVQAHAPTASAQSNR